MNIADEEDGFFDAVAIGNLAQNDTTFTLCVIERYSGTTIRFAFVTY